MDYYYLLPSPPCRATLLTAAALGLDLNKKVVNIQANEHKTPEFLEINPQHCIPTLVDGDFKMWESRAICTYLVNKYGKDDSLYPKDPVKRANVDKLLYFDMGKLYGDYGKYLFPVLRSGSKPDSEKLEKLHETLKLFDSMLEGKSYASGSSAPTVADHSLIASVSSMIAGGIDVSSYPNINGWVERCSKNMPGYEENQQGADIFGNYVKEKMSAAK